VQFSGERQKTSRKFISVEIQYSLTNVRYCVSTTDKYRAEEPRYLWYCSTKLAIKSQAQELTDFTTFHDAVYILLMLI